MFLIIKIIFPILSAPNNFTASLTREPIAPIYDAMLVIHLNYFDASAAAKDRTLVPALLDELDNDAPFIDRSKVLDILKDADLIYPGMTGLDDLNALVDVLLFNLLESLLLAHKIGG